MTGGDPKPSLHFSVRLWNSNKCIAGEDVQNGGTLIKKDDFRAFESDSCLINGHLFVAKLPCPHQVLKTIITRRLTVALFWCVLPLYLAKAFACPLRA